MLENLLVVCGQVATLFLMMGVGFILAKRGWLDPHGMSQMSTVLLYVVAPCIFLKSFQQPGLPPLGVLGMAALSVVVYYAVFIPITSMLFRKTEPPTGAVLRFGTLYSNSAFMGLPLLQMVLGPESVIFGVIYFVFMSLSQWTQGAVMMGGQALSEEGPHQPRYGGPAPRSAPPPLPLAAAHGGEYGGILYGRPEQPTGHDCHRRPDCGG